MKIARLLKTVLVVGVVSACICMLAGCTGTNGGGGVAATVNGKDIPEEQVTKQVEQVRAQSGLSDDEQWGKFLVQNDLTPESVREDVINGIAQEQLIKEGATQLEIEVPDTDVDEAVSSFKANFSTDEAWQDALKQAGFTEESYRESIGGSMIEQKLASHFEEGIEPTEEDIVNAVKTYAPYYDGAKRSSHILFKVDDVTDEAAMAEATAQAQNVLGQINNGMDFAEAARQYSGDEGSAAEGGDVGWDKLNSFVSEYTDALTNLEVNQVSEPVTSQYGVHLIKVTETYTAPEADALNSLDQVPEGFRENIREMAISVKANSLYGEWVEDLKEDAEININPMPKGLPYDIDLTPYQEEQEAEDAATGTAAPDAADAAAADEAITDEVITDEGLTVDPATEDVTVDETLTESPDANAATGQNAQ